MKTKILIICWSLALLACAKVEDDFSELNKFYTLKSDEIQSISFLKIFIQVKDEGNQNAAKNYMDLALKHHAQNPKTGISYMFFSKKYNCEFKIPIKHFNTFMKDFQSETYQPKIEKAEWFLEYKKKLPNNVSEAQHWTSTKKALLPILLPETQLKGLMNFIPPIRSEIDPSTILYDSVQVVILGR